MVYNETYEEFVEKFKPKKTTDDCYTPSLVYETIKEWVVAEYHLQEKTIKRPFYPGGDYQKISYEKNDVVIDNPPFSILAQITDFFTEKKIPFFLFAPHLTVFNLLFHRDICVIITDATITYENGAKVNTAFITNLEKAGIRTAPNLRKMIRKADKNFRQQKQKNILSYQYPDNVLTSVKLGQYSDNIFRVEKEQYINIRQLDCQKKYKKTIYGSGVLMCDKKTKELKNMLKNTELKDTNLKDIDKIVLELSLREKEMIKKLSWKG